MADETRILRLFAAAATADGRLSASEEALLGDYGRRLGVADERTAAIVGDPARRQA